MSSNRNDSAPSVAYRKKETKSNGICLHKCFKEELVMKIRRTMPKEGELISITEVFQILSDKTRLKMLLSLAQEELCVCDVANVTELSLSATSHQLKTLRQCGLVSYRTDGRMVYYRITDQGRNALRVVDQLRRLRK